MQAHYSYGLVELNGDEREVIGQIVQSRSEEVGAAVAAARDRHALDDVIGDALEDHAALMAAVEDGLLEGGPDTAAIVAEYREHAPGGGREVCDSIVARLAAAKESGPTLLQHLREASRLTRAALADRLGVDAETIERWEGGEPIPEQYQAPLAGLFGVSVAYLTGSYGTRPVASIELDDRECAAVRQIVRTFANSVAMEVEHADSVAKLDAALDRADLHLHLLHAAEGRQLAAADEKVAEYIARYRADLKRRLDDNADALRKQLAGDDLPPGMGWQESTRESGRLINVDLPLIEACDSILARLASEDTSPRE